MEVLTGENHALEATSPEAYGISGDVGLGPPHHSVTLGQPGSVERTEAWRREGLDGFPKPQVRPCGRCCDTLGGLLPLSEEPQQLVTNRHVKPGDQVVARGVLVSESGLRERPGKQQPDGPFPDRA